MIEPRYSVLQGLFAERVFRIPHYQRFYSWTTRQRDDLWSDIEKLATRADDQHHFMATLVCHRTNETKSIGASKYGIFDIVDGQQRMTTLILLLKCIERAMAPESEDRKELAKILVKRDGHLILLQTNNVNEHIFNSFIRDGKLPKEEDLETHSDINLADGISECGEFVKQWEKRGDDIADLLSLVLHRLGFVVYDTEDNRVVYTVFEVLNSRGLAVDWIDKTKSVLMGLASELSKSKAARNAAIDNLQSIWANIYREIAKEDIAGDEILRMTATLYYGSGAGKPLGADDSLKVIREHCGTADMTRVVSERLLDVSKKLVTVYGSIHLGPVTKILHARLLAVAILLAKGVKNHERATLLDLWERVTFRVFELSNNDARTRVGEYVRASARIVREDPEMRTAKQIMGSIAEIGADFPIDSGVETGLKNVDWYSRSPETCRYILWQYEEYLTQKLGKGATVDEHERNAIWKVRASDSIEHIFPQSPGLAWKGKMRRAGGKDQPLESHVGRIGNLVLLPIILNQEAKAHPFAQKKLSYAKHNLRTMQDIIREDDWTLEQIEAREAAIMEWAKTRWCDL
jgi:Protein of unknown function DUF262/Protein of unknown function (DUF1524)